MVSFLSIFLSSTIFSSPAIEAALAGSTKIPSSRASWVCALSIWMSVTVSAVPFESRIARRTFGQFTGERILIAVAIVSALATGNTLLAWFLIAWTIGAALAACIPIILGLFFDS